MYMLFQNVHMLLNLILYFLLYLFRFLNNNLLYNIAFRPILPLLFFQMMRHYMLMLGYILHFLNSLFHR